MIQKCFAAVPFFIVFVVYLVSPMRGMADSKYYVYLCSALINRASSDLGTDAERAGLLGHGNTRLPYQLVESASGRITHFFPHGSAFIAAPFVKVAEMLSLGLPKGDYDLGRESDIQHFIASLFATLAVAALYWSIRAWLPPLQATLIVVAFAFGTSFYTTASRVLWSHSAELMLCTAGLALALRYREDDRIVPILLLASIIAWLPFVRPTAFLSSCGLIAISSRKSARYLIITAITLAFWALLFGLYSQNTFGSPLPPYFDQVRSSSDSFFVALLGITVSPSRGLFIYSPVTVLAFFALQPRVIMALTGHQRLVAGISLAVTLGHLVVIAHHHGWWGGHCIGPRLMTDVLPWSAMLIAAWLAGINKRGQVVTSGNAIGCATRSILKSPALILLIMLSTLSIALHTYAAISNAPKMWSMLQDVEKSPERVFSWREAQPWAGLFDAKSATKTGQ